MARTRIGIAVVVLALLPPGSLRGEGGAVLSLGEDSLQWVPTGPILSATLTVASPDGQVDAFEFGANAAPVLSIFDASGRSLADGTYTWELRMTPEAYDARAAERMPPITDSGYFTILHGELLPAGRQEHLSAESDSANSRLGRREPHVAESQTVTGDLSIDGKACVGRGCSASEVFGNNTLRLKQSVVRLQFVDTSTQSGYASTDWQFTINGTPTDSAVNRFSIEDLDAGTTPFTIKGGSPNDSLYIAAPLGHVGIGTAAPEKPLHVKGHTAGSVMFLQNTNPAGFAGLHFLTSQGAADSFFGIRHDLGVTALESVGTPFVFRMGGYERMRIVGAGLVGIGCENPGHKLVLHAGAGADCGTGPNSWIDAGDSAFTGTSSRSIKENLKAVHIPDILERVRTVDVFTYDFIDGAADKIGLMAEEFHGIFGRGSDKFISGQEVQMALWLAVQELTKRSRDQEELIERQNALIEGLSKRIGGHGTDH